MATRAAARLGLCEIRCIAVDRQNHVAGVISEDRVRVGGNIVEEIQCLLHCARGRRGLVGSNSAERDQHGGVNGAGIVEECSCHLLDEFCVFFVKQGGVVLGWGVLNLGPIRGNGMSVGLVSKFCLVCERIL